MKRKNNLFNYVPVQAPKRNLFDLSHEVKMSGKFSYLYPVLLLDCMPGDTIREDATVFLRAAPMLAPIMHRCDVTVHSFFIPYRLLTPLWEDFITGGQNGTAEPVLPFITPAALENIANNSDKMRAGTLWDYLGLPTWNTAGTIPDPVSIQQLSALPFVAYLKIWNDYYRDPNLDTELDLDTVGVTGNVTVALNLLGGFDLRARGWQKDYFTSALPWAQRGSEVLMPLAGSGNVTYLPVSRYLESDGVTTPADGPVSFDDTPITYSVLTSDGGLNYTQVQNIDEVNITTSSVSINDLRMSLALQRWMENNARGGGRYIEQIQAHYNVKVPDYRLQRAEYLGGGKQPIQISEVLATADSEDVPVGDMAGHGISVGKTNRWTYRCQEHGLVMSILSVMPQTAYSQGVERLWTKESRFDYAFPELAHLGEQEILSKEVFMTFQDQPENDDVFGYIPRYAEYKFKNDRVAGAFRTTLGFWHLGRNFTSRPVLNSAFTTMQENSPSLEETYRRIFAVQDGTDYFWMQVFHRCTAKRPLPYFGVPQLIG